jgi:hypothetical protein
MEYFIDVSYGTLIKEDEELPGDMVNIIRQKDCTIIVMADGLGSGVKANILATLTSRIAGTMLKEGAHIYETVDTIANTLPVCKIRNIAYSTFTLLKIYNDGKVYMAEYDNPPIFFIRNSENVEIDKKEILINGKSIKESHYILQAGDLLTIVSDGVTHAGLGDILNLGWQWMDINKYIKKISTIMDSKCLTEDLLQSCWSLYRGKPGDDTTVVSVKVKKPSYVSLFTGPPKNKENDTKAIKDFISTPGKKIICGGTAANIVERELKRELKVNLDFSNPQIPPTAYMEGIDLVTEGIITLSKVVDELKKYSAPFDIGKQNLNFNGTDGVSKLINILINECTNLNIFVGKAINPAHQNPDFPFEFTIKVKVIEELSNIMKDLGKTVNIYYIE